MKGNYLVCHNEIFVEGVSIGPFENMKTTGDRENLSTTAEIELPLYTIAAYEDGRPPGEDVPLTRKVRVGIEMDKLKTGAQIEVYAWYDCPEIDINFERTLIFKGYIRQVVGAFPSVIKCEDMSFPLRFGTVGTVWKNMSTLKDVVNAVLPISEKAFSEYRAKQGLDDNWTRITVASSELADAAFDMKAWKDISPFDALQKLITLFAVFGNVDNEARLYIGAGQSAPTNKTVELSTKLNVIGCDLTTTNGLFENYSVTVTSRTSDGKLIKYTYGDPDGEAFPTRMMPLNTEIGIKEFAKRLYYTLTGNRNAGTITTLLYPRAELFDFITFEHTLFPELSGDYVAIGVENNLDNDGFRQVINVTNKKFVI